jgi:hypothetical protein
MELEEKYYFDKYNEMMKKAISEIDSEFKVDYTIESETHPVFKEAIFASGQITLHGFNNFNYMYHFILGKNGMAISDYFDPDYKKLSKKLCGREEDFNKDIHIKIAKFNENLAKKLNFSKLALLEESLNVKNIYESLGYKFNNNYGVKQLN